MKIMLSTIVVAGVSLASAHVTSAAPAITVSLGAGAVADFDQLSADGCTHTTGQLVVLQASPGGELANGLYVTGSQEDLCYGTFGNGFAGYAAGGYVVPLIVAGYRGTVVVDSYSGGAPVTLELDVTWFGRGATTKTHGVFDDGTTIDLSWSRTRDARVVGTFHVDGEPATTSNAQLVFQASGTITRP